MAAKRGATSDINHTNWHVEDEPEEAGSFSKAPEDILKNRVIKVAKRRNPIGTLAASEGEKKAAFAGFGGFNKTPASTASSSPFSFLSNLTSKSNEQPKTNGLTDAFSMKTSSTKATDVFKLPESRSTVSPFTMSQKQYPKKSKEYYAKLKGLNQSVSSWIKRHVDENPFLNLTPVFRDYEKYLDEIEKAHIEDETDNLSQPAQKDAEFKSITSTKTETQKVVSTFTFKPSEGNASGSKTTSFTSSFTNTTLTKLTEAEQLEEEKVKKFSFGSASENPSSAPTFSFGKPNVQPITSSAGFSFGGDASKPFTFSNVAKPKDTEGSKEENEDDEEPPKVEFSPVVEEGHIYTIRCKVFVKKDGKFGDRGVGNLYLKPVPDNDKVQLIVRADTSLGNLLCNFILSTSIPMQRVGKKDVMLVCIPTPESKPPPLPVLFRVKSSEEADELLRTLEKHKK